MLAIKPSFSVKIKILMFLSEVLFWLERWLRLTSESILMDVSFSFHPTQIYINKKRRFVFFRTIHLSFAMVANVKVEFNYSTVEWLWPLKNIPIKKGLFIRTTFSSLFIIIFAHHGLSEGVIVFKLSCVACVYTYMFSPTLEFNFQIYGIWYDSMCEWATLQLLYYFFLETADFHQHLQR